jgi:hypothetical protein
VPVYGTLRFKDDAGRDSDKGINVGHEWTYRTFIKGGTQAAAIWTFDGVTEDLFPKGIPLEMTLEIYRTYKGDVEKGILGSLALRNPKTGRKALLRNFYAKEFREPDVQFVPRTWMAVEYGKSSKPQSVDLFRDLVADGKVEVWIQCITPAQCFGMAKADVYLRARSAPFWLNFAKGYAGIWLQMVVVLGLAVMFSTFLSEPVALVAAGGMLVAGLVRGFMLQVAMHQIEGGGPFESFIRMVLQLSVTAEMEQNLLTHVAQMLDRLLEAGLRMLVAVVPTIGDFSFDEFVATGFDVNGDWLLQCVSRALAYALAMFLAGYLFLKTREVAR